MVIDWQILIHVVLFAVWFGTGLSGMVVMMQARGASQGKIALVRVALLLERIARTAFVLMLPAGLQLASDLGLVHLSGLGAAGTWLLGLLWVAVLWAHPPERGDSFAKAMRMTGRVLLAVVGVLMLGWAILGLLGSTIAIPSWLAGKFAIFGSVLFLTLTGDVLHDPLLAHLSGSKDEQEGADLAATLAYFAPRFLIMQILILFGLAAAAYIGLVRASLL